MQVIDLNYTDGRVLLQQSQICIIGAGAAGLYLAVRMAEQGLDVIVVEAGDKKCVADSEIGLEAEFGDQYYSGATSGRYFGLGGSTSKWGGALVPHIEDDQLADDQQRVWEHVVRQVERHSPVVLQTLGFPIHTAFPDLGKKYFAAQSKALELSGIKPMSNLFLPFERKNFSVLLKPNTTKGGRIRLVLNAVVAEWKWSTNEYKPRIKACVAKNKQQKRIEIQSSKFIMAAGAIESARILLEIRRQSGDILLKKNDALGHYLSDHLSSHVADVLPKDAQTIASIFGPRFFHGDMRSFRFIEQDKPSGSRRSFFHFIFEINDPGFALAKKVLSGLQSRQIPKITLYELAKGMVSTAALGYTRFALNRLRIPPGTPTHLQLDIEQIPSFANRIELSNELDIYGRPKSIIYWKINNEDYRNIEETTQRFLHKWPGPSQLLPELLFHKTGALGPKPHDAYHPVGTCRMGIYDSVVDMDLKVNGLENVYVLSTAVFPTAGSANPTFSMLCLGEKLAKHLEYTLGNA